MAQRAVPEKEQGILLDQLRTELGDAGYGNLRITKLGECRYRGYVEAGAIKPGDPFDLVDGRETLNRLNGFGRLGAVVVFDQLDFLLAILEF